MSAPGIKSVAQSGIVPYNVQYYDTTPSSYSSCRDVTPSFTPPFMPPPPPSPKQQLTQSYYNLDTLTTPSPLPIYGTVTAFAFLALPTALHPRHNPSSTNNGPQLVHLALFFISLLFKYVKGFKRSVSSNLWVGDRAMLGDI